MKQKSILNSITFTALALALALPLGGKNVGLMDTAITAKAAEGSAELVGEGVLLLKGEITEDMITNFPKKEQVTKIQAENDCVLPNGLKLNETRKNSWPSLKEIDLSEANTENCKSMAGMFANCSAVESVSIIVTYRTENLSEMFRGCSALENIKMEDWDTSEVSNLSYMFAECSSLRYVEGIPSRDFTSVTTMDSMFKECESLMEVDFSGVQTERLVDVSEMFCKCDNLETVYLGNIITSATKSMEAMFVDCNKLENVDFSTTDTSGATNMKSMFWSCGALLKLDLSSFDTSNVKEMAHMFAFCEKLKTIIVSELWNTDKLIDSGEGMFEDCHKIVGGNGTAYSILNDDALYARIDISKDIPGYLTSKDSSGNIHARPNSFGTGTIDLTNKTAVITDKDIATAILYTINGAIADNDIAIIKEEELSLETTIDELDIDVDKNKTVDIIVKCTMNATGDYAVYMEITALDTRSVKESRTLIMPEFMADWMEKGGFPYYDTLKFVFNVPKAVIPSNNRVDKVAEQPAAQEEHKKGDVLTIGKNSYKILATENGKRAVSFMGTVNSKAKSVKVPDTVKIDGEKYKVTEINAKAFNGMKKLKKVTIGKNVNKIGNKAFSGCKKLMNIKVSTTKLKAKNLGKKAFANMSPNSVIKVPAKVRDAYRKLFKKKGYKGKVV